MDNIVMQISYFKKLLAVLNITITLAIGVVIFYPSVTLADVDCPTPFNPPSSD
jgi:hypothetical protein